MLNSNYPNSGKNGRDVTRENGQNIKVEIIHMRDERSAILQ